MNKYFIFLFIIFLIVYSYAIMEPTGSRTYISSISPISPSVVVNNYPYDPQTANYYDRQYEILRQNLL